jgi:hypothetical protein
LEAIEDLRVTERIDAWHRDREQLEELQERTQREARVLASELSSRAITVRDIGAILGVSFQRAKQLIDAGGAHPAHDPAAGTGSFAAAAIAKHESVSVSGRSRTSSALASSSAEQRGRRAKVKAKAKAKAK